MRRGIGEISLTPFPMKIPHFWGPKFHYHNNSFIIISILGLIITILTATTSQATQLKDMQYFISVLAGISLFSASGS